MEKKILEKEKSFAVIGGQRDRKDRIDKLFVRAEGSEDVSRREKSVKYFNLSGNRHQAVVYGEAIHYRDPQTGKWEDIDNTLVEAVTEHGRNVLRNRAGSMRVEFPRRADGGSMVAVTENGRTFSWRFEHEAQPVEAKIRTGEQMKKDRLVKLAQKMPKYVGRTVESLRAADLSAEIETAQERRTEVVKLRSENIYENILPGVSVRYLLAGNEVKEDIIVDNPAALAYTAIRLPDEFEYEATSDSKLIVKDKANGKRLFTMDTPLILDAADKRINGSIILTPCAGYTRMEYVIDADFLAEAVFPITIDPVVKTDTSDGDVEITDITLQSGSSSHNASDEYLRCGIDDDVEYASFLKFANIPKLKASDTLISAEIQLKQNSSTTSRCIAAYEILKEWDSDTILPTVNWTSFNPYDEETVSTEILDCIKGMGYSNADLKFDVTNLYRKYYTGEKDFNQNYGVAFHTPANFNAGGVTEKNYSRMYSSDKNGEYYHPKLCLNFLSHAGLEGWWHYEQMAAGRAGTVYADMFNGNVVLAHADTAMTGSRMPVSVTHYYNSCLSSKNDFFCGFGWRTNAHQFVEKVTLNETDYFVWTDGDGTEHYFKKIDGTHTFYDDEGMGLKLNYSYDNSSPANYVFTLTDKGHNKSTFTGPQDGKGWIQKTEDSCGNTVTYTFDATNKSQILSITDGSGRITRFTYKNGLMDTIITPDVGDTERVVTFGYSNSRLSTIAYSELVNVIPEQNLYAAPHTVYSYDGSSKLLISAENYDGAKVNITYNVPGFENADLTEGTIEEYRRVHSLEYVNGNSAGAKQIFAYKDMCTEVTAVEGTYESDKDKKLIYQFNDSGNVVCVRDELGYAYFTKFESGIENKASDQSPMRKAVVNLLRNPDLVNKEDENGDVDSVWVASATGVARDTSKACLNAAPVKITGDASELRRYRQEVALENKKKYVFSAFVKTDTVNVNSEGAYISLTPKTGGTVVKSFPITGSTDVAVGNELPMDGWERVHVNLDLSNLSDGTTSYYADLCLNGTGTAWFACPQLEVGSILSPVNLISNGDFRYADSFNVGSSPKDWLKKANNLSTTATGVCVRNDDMPAALSGGFVQVEGRPNKTNVGFQQVIEVTGNEDDIFVLGGWVNAQSVPNANTDDRHCALTVELRKSDGTYTDPTVFAFNSEHVGWQFGCWAMAATRNYKAIRVSVSYSENCCTAQFSNVFLHREQFGESFVYDDEENIISASTLAGQKTHIKYDNADNIRRYVQPGLDDGVDSNYFRMSYGDDVEDQERHRMLSHRTPEGVTDRYDYDEHGNCIASVRVNVADIDTALGSLTKNYIRTEVEYDEKKNYATVTRDARGNEVTKAVDSNTGLVHSVTDPADQTVNYTYDKAKRVTQVATTVGSNTYKNTYTYDHDRIKTVSHNTTTATPDVTYTFDYDELGRKTTVKVGNQVLSTNKYKGNSRSSLLEKVGYGTYNESQAKFECGEVSYTYDEFDRMTSVKYDNATTPRYSYDYGNNGQVGEVRDSNLGRITRTEYDLIDRPCKVEITDNTPQENLLYRTQLKYDKRSNLKTFFEKLPAEEHATDYEYDNDNRITKLTYDGSATIDYSFNALGRMSERIATVGSNEYLTQYAYVKGGYPTPEAPSTKSHTFLVESITQPGMNFSYEYDNRGNIISETRNNVETTYAYDALGQLIRVNDPNDTTAGANGTTWVYEYDFGGNIKKKTPHPYTTGIPSGGTAINYGYDNDWKDKLVSYDGKDLEYDLIGNLTSFDGWTYTWEGGRQLKKMEKTGMTVEFKYNHNGLRTQKIVTEGTTKTITEYTLHGKLITHLTKRVVDGQNIETGREELHFFYDSQSRPAFVEYDNTMYRYVHNLQGDIVAIVDTVGGLVVEYKYDAWGKLVAISGSLSSTLGILNIFRYRSYVFDEETKLYYLSKRYYNTVGRWINLDARFASSNILDSALYSYCGNDPINRFDPTGEAWWHWLLGAAVVATCAIATVVTCGGFTAAATAVYMVGNGLAAATASSTLVASAFVGSSIAYGTAAVTALSQSSSVEEFNSYGNWGTVAVSAGGALAGGALSYTCSKTSMTTLYRSISKAEAQDIASTGRFNLAYGGMECKQFGLNLAETQAFGRKMGQDIIASVQIPTEMLDQFYRGGVDTSIFLSGTVTIYGEQLNAFNQAIIGTIKIMQ